MSLPLAAFSASWAFVIAAWAEPLASLIPDWAVLVHGVDADLVLLDALLRLLHLGGDGVHLLVDLAHLALHVGLLGAAREGDTRRQKRHDQGSHSMTSLTRRPGEGFRPGRRGTTQDGGT